MTDLKTSPPQRALSSKQRASKRLFGDIEHLDQPYMAEQMDDKFNDDDGVRARLITPNELIAEIEAADRQSPAGNEIKGSDGGVENRRHAARGSATPKTGADWQEGGQLGSASPQGKHPEEHIAGVASGPSEAIEARITLLSDALKSISKNTCCDNCREAANVARSALASYVGLAREAHSQPESISEHELTAAIVEARHNDAMSRKIAFDLLSKFNITRKS